MSDVTPVDVQNTDPIPVTVGEVDTPAQSDARVVAASSKVEADILRTQDQRRISGIWERTQQIIALSVVETVLIVSAVLALAPSLTTISGSPADNTSITSSIAGMLFLTGVANLVIGFYFGRTNHSRTGGSDGPSRDA